MRPAINYSPVNFQSDRTSSFRTKCKNIPSIENEQGNRKNQTLFGASPHEVDIYGMVIYIWLYGIYMVIYMVIYMAIYIQLKTCTACVCMCVDRSGCPGLHL